MRLRLIATAGVAALLGAAAVQAQTPPGPGQGPGREPRITAPTDPNAVPGDFMDMTQTAQLKVNLGPPAGPRPASQKQRPPRVDNTPTPGYDAAIAAAQAAVASCKADGYTVAVAVTDSVGNLKAALAPDGTRNNGVFMALRKDVTVVGFKMSTLALREKMATDSSLMSQVKPNMSLLPGGLPIVKDGQFIGAIAASGAAAYEEEKCAGDGLKKIVP